MKTSPCRQAGVALTPLPAALGDIRPVLFGSVQEGPLPTDQVNLTDEESRVMPVAGSGFDQCYNAQAMIAAGSLLVVATEVVQAANEKQ